MDYGEGPVRFVPEDDGRLTCRASLPCAPYGIRSAVFECKNDEKGAVNKFFDWLTGVWPIVWPEIAAIVTRQLSDYERPDCFSTESFEIRINAHGQAWHESGWCVEIVFEQTDGYWTVWFNEIEVVGEQASF